MICFYIIIHTYTRVVRVYFYIYRYVVIDTQIIFSSGFLSAEAISLIQGLGNVWSTSDQLADLHPRKPPNGGKPIWEMLPDWVSFKVACEFWVAETLITFLKYLIKLIRFVKISTDLLFYFSHFPKDSHKTSEFWTIIIQNLTPFHRLGTSGGFVFPRGKTWCPTSKTFQHGTPRFTSARIHGLDIPWRIDIPSGPFGWFVEGIVRYGVVVSIFLNLFSPRKFGKIPILTLSRYKGVETTN